MNTYFKVSLNQYLWEQKVSDSWANSPGGIRTTALFVIEI